VRRLSALAALALLPLAPACSGGDVPAPRPPGALAAAIQDRERVGSFRLRFLFELDFQLARATSVGKGVANADWTRSRMAASSEGWSGPFDDETIVVDDHYWTRGDVDDLPKGKVWVRGDVTPEDSGSLMTPEQFLALVRGVPEVERAGTARIRGRATTMLRAPLTGRRLDEAWDTDQLRELIRTVTEERAPRADRLRGTAELWVDGDDRIARERLTIRVPGHDTIRLTTDYLAYGVSLASAQAPDPRTVIDEEDLDE
jgi:hypothetical protein